MLVLCIIDLYSLRENVYEIANEHMINIHTAINYKFKSSTYEYEFIIYLSCPHNNNDDNNTNMSNANSENLTKSTISFDYELPEINSKLNRFYLQTNSALT